MKEANRVLAKANDVKYNISKLWAGLRTQVHLGRGSSPPLVLGGFILRELSVFIDESGDYGEYDYHSPYYIISMVFHDQDVAIEDAVRKLNRELSYTNLDGLCIHTGPIIRMEEIYNVMTKKERRTILNKLVAFVRNVDIRYACFSVEKKHIDGAVGIVSELSKQIASFIRGNYSEFLAYDVVKIYYDNGQHEVTKMLASVFSALLPRIEFKRVMPVDYKLFQVADLMCTMHLIKLKLESEGLSKSEIQFFGSVNDLKKNYLQRIEKKKWI